MIAYRMRGTVPSERPDAGEVYRPREYTRVIDLSDYFVDDDGEIHRIDYVYVVLPDKAVGFLTSTVGTLFPLYEKKVVQYRYILADNNHMNDLDAIEIMVE